ARMDRGPAELGQHDVRVSFDEQSASRPTEDVESDLVRHRRGGNEDGLLLPEELGPATLELVHGRVLALLLVPHLGVRHRVAHALAGQFALPYSDLAAKSVDPTVAGLLPLEVARRLFAVPVRFVGEDGIQVAIADPTDVDAALLEGVLRQRVELVIAERSAIQ